MSHAHLALSSAYFRRRSCHFGPSFLRKSSTETFVLACSFESWRPSSALRYLRHVSSSEGIGRRGSSCWRAKVRDSGLSSSNLVTGCEWARLKTTIAAGQLRARAGGRGAYGEYALYQTWKWVLNRRRRSWQDVLPEPGRIALERCELGDGRGIAHGLARAGALAQCGVITCPRLLTPRSISPSPPAPPRDPAKAAMMSYPSNE